MTKALAVVALLALLVATLPGASAHGAPPVRPIDTRVVADDDGPLGFGGCLAGTCAAPTGAAADLLALDVREASFPDGSPALVFRFVLQSEEPPAGAALAMTFTAQGTAKTLSAATADGLAWTSADFDRVDGPFPVGDGHPKAVDAWVRADRLGVAPGDVLADIAVSSSRDGATDDVMPGGWFAQGIEVAAPAVPGTEADLPMYTVQGPAALLKLEAAPAAGLLAPASATLLLTNAVAFPQFVDIALVLPAGTTARLGQSAVNVDANGSREVQLTVTSALGNGTVRIVAVSDLGAYAVLDVPVSAPPTPANATATGHHDHHEDAHGDTEEDDGSKDTPGPAAPLLAAALVVVALALRRRLA